MGKGGKDVREVGNCDSNYVSTYILPGCPSPISHTFIIPSLCSKGIALRTVNAMPGGQVLLVASIDTVTFDLDTCAYV